MKIKKSAQQKNVMLNKAYYNDYEINEMLKNREIFYIDFARKEGDPWECYETVDRYDCEDNIFRIYTENISDLNIELIEGFYHTIATGKNGKKYYIEL